MKKVILTILDGVGEKKEEYGNAFKLANTPTIDYLLNNYPHSLLNASGEAVGLPKNQMGNSEVGHITIGSGRIVNQPLQKINKAIEDKSFYKNEAILKVIHHSIENNSKLHILGLISDGGVHSSFNHVTSLIKMAKQNGVRKLYIHVFLDGRDTLPNVCLTYLNQLTKYIEEIHLGEIATISGRYYAMDREGMWDKTKLAYDAIVNNYGKYNKNYKKLIEESYLAEEYDEFVVPTIINKNGVIEDNDGLILANFRPDRVTQLFSAITNPNFNKFQAKTLNNIKLVTMMPVSREVVCTNAFNHDEIINTLGEILSKKGVKSLRIAEVSKFPHVTRFFDGDIDIELKNTTKIKIPRKEVETYDLYPEMSAVEVTDKIIKQLKNYEFVLVNYANGDMVGHTGNLQASIKAMECLDKCIKRIYEKAKENNYLLVICADHGNLEEMIDSDGNMLTAHTTNPINLIVCDKNYLAYNGGLSNIAPSILNIMGIPIPSEMEKELVIEEKL